MRRRGRGDDTTTEADDRGKDGCIGRCARRRVDRRWRHRSKDDATARGRNEAVATTLLSRTPMTTSTAAWRDRRGAAAVTVDMLLMGMKMGSATRGFRGAIAARGKTRVVRAQTEATAAAAGVA